LERLARTSLMQREAQRVSKSAYKLQKMTLNCKNQVLRSRMASAILALESLQQRHSRASAKHQGFQSTIHTQQKQDHEC